MLTYARTIRLQSITRLLGKRLLGKRLLGKRLLGKRLLGKRLLGKRLLGVLGVSCLSPFLWALGAGAEMPDLDAGQPVGSQAESGDWTVWQQVPMPPVLGGSELRGSELRGSELRVLAVPPVMAVQWPDLSLEADIPRSPLAVNCLNFVGPEYRPLDCRRLGAIGGPELGPDFLPPAVSGVRVYEGLRPVTQMKGLFQDFASDAVRSAEVRVLF
jgi:hypothetical protein